MTKMLRVGAVLGAVVMIAGVVKADEAQVKMLQAQ